MDLLGQWMDIGASSRQEYSNLPYLLWTIINDNSHKQTRQTRIPYSAEQLTRMLCEDNWDVAITTSVLYYGDLQHQMPLWKDKGRIPP